MRLLIFAFLLAGCASLNPITLMRLNAVDPLLADPADFAVDLTLPDGMAAMPETVRLTWVGERRDTDETLNEVFVLERSGDVFHIASDDLDRFRHVQASLRSWNDVTPNSASGSMGMQMGFCILGNGPAPDARIDVAIRMTEGGVFLPLVSNGPISAVASPKDIAEMVRCQ